MCDHHSCHSIWETQVQPSSILVQISTEGLEIIEKKELPLTIHISKQQDLRSQASNRLFDSHLAKQMLSYIVQIMAKTLVSFRVFSNIKILKLQVPRIAYQMYNGLLDKSAHPRVRNIINSSFSETPTINNDNVFPNTDVKTSLAGFPCTLKKSTRNRYSRQLLSNNAQCSLRNKLSNVC